MTADNTDVGNRPVLLGNRSRSASCFDQAEAGTVKSLSEGGPEPINIFQLYRYAVW